MGSFLVILIICEATNMVMLEIYVNLNILPIILDIHVMHEIRIN